MVQRALKEAGFWVILGVNKGHIRAFSLHPTYTAVVYCRKDDGSRSVAFSVDWGRLALRLVSTRDLDERIIQIEA